MKKDSTPIPVVQLNLEGRYINEYPNMMDAAFKTITSQSSIGHCLAGRVISANNYIWIAKNVYSPEKNYSLKWLKKKREFLKSK